MAPLVVCALAVLSVCDRLPVLPQALINVVDAMLSQRTGAETVVYALDALGTAALCPLVRAPWSMSLLLGLLLPWLSSHWRPL